MKKSKWQMITCALLAGVLGMCLCACGGGINVGGKNNNNDDSTLTIGITGDSGEATAIDTLRKPFENMYKAVTGKAITVQTVRIDGGYISGVQKLLNAKNLPNIIQVYDYASEYLTYRKVLVPISEYMSRDSVSESEIAPAVLSFMKSGGASDDKVYWMSRDYNRVTVMYNKDIFDAAGVDYPQNGWTWNDFTDTCAALKANAAQIRAVTGQDNFYAVDANLNFEAVFYPAIRSFGGDLYDTATGKAFKNEAGVKAGLTKLYSLLQNGYAVSPTNGGNVFATKEAAMYFCVRPNIVSAATHLKHADGTFPIDFVTMPSYNDTETTYVGMGCTGYGISTSCPESKRDLAWAFLKFVASKDGQELLSKSGSGFPMRNDMFNDTAAFNDFLPDADHSAFYADPAGSKNKDLAMNFLQGFKVEKHNAVYNDVIKSNLFTTLDVAKNADSFYSDLKARLNSVIA